MQLPAVIDAQRVTAARKAAKTNPKASSSAASSSAPSSSALEEYKTTFVITPAISLMSDQVMQINATLRRHTKPSDLAELGLSPGADFAVFLGRGQEDKAVADAVKRGEHRLVFLTEQLLADVTWMHALQSLDAQRKLLMIAVDEAHCVVQYPESGSFRMHYGDLGKLRTMLPFVPIMALSAVPTREMWARIEQSLGMRADTVVRTIGSIYR